MPAPDAEPPPVAEAVPTWTSGPRGRSRANAATAATAIAASAIHRPRRPPRLRRGASASRWIRRRERSGGDVDMQLRAWLKGVKRTEPRGGWSSQRRLDPAIGSEPEHGD